MLRFSVVARAAGFALSAALYQKKPQTATNAYLAGASKTGSEEKWAQAAMEYIYEKNHVNDARKRQSDLQAEQKLSAAYDRLCEVNQAHFEHRLSRLMARMAESLSAVRALGLEQCFDECLLMQAEQPPGNYRRPSLSPPVQGYEPGFGLDVPQLKNQQSEYPAVTRPTDHLQYSASALAAGGGQLAFAEKEEDATAGERDGSGGGDGDGDGGEAASYFPYVDAHEIEDLTSTLAEDLERLHGEIREAAPLTGVEGEAWEAYAALQKKALARQKLIFDLSNDPDFHQRYTRDAALRAWEWERRGMLPLVVEEEEGGKERIAEHSSLLTERWAERARSPARHFAQEPAYQPFRAS